MQIWQILIALGGLFTPIVLTVMARDRSLMNMISQTQRSLGDQVKAETDPLHERVNRIRDEFVRRDDLDGHLKRMEKQFDDIRAEMRRGSENVDKRLSEILKYLSKG